MNFRCLSPTGFIFSCSIREQVDRARRDGDADTCFPIEKPLRGEEDARSWCPLIDTGRFEVEDDQTDLDRHTRYFDRDIVQCGGKCVQQRESDRLPKPLFSQAQLLLIPPHLLRRIGTAPIVASQVRKPPARGLDHKVQTRCVILAVIYFITQAHILNGTVFFPRPGKTCSNQQNGNLGQPSTYFLMVL